MRSSKRIFILSLAAAACLALAGAPAWAQNTTVKGKVTDSDTNRPISGATVDFLRTDDKGTVTAKTDAGGNFSQQVATGGTYVIVVSHSGRAPKVMPNVKPATGLPTLEFALGAGNGERPDLDEVNKLLSGAADEEYEKQVALKGQFDAKKARFDTGVKAMQSKDYNTAVAELTAALEGLDNADVAYWGELVNAAGGNLAETHYRVAVDRYNSGSKDEAKSHLERGARAIAMAIRANPAEPVNYAIQGKTILLLVDKFGMVDEAETGAAAFVKASEHEKADKKLQVEYLVKAGDVYRAAYMTDKAIESYKRALALDSNNLSAYYGIGLAAMGTSEQDDEKRRAVWQVAADYMKAFVDKAPSDPRAQEIKPLLDTLAKDYKIRPRSLK